MGTEDSNFDSMSNVPQWLSNYMSGPVETEKNCLIYFSPDPHYPLTSTERYLRFTKMSTRGIVGVRVNGIDKLSYNHSDSYPAGLGVDTLNFLTQALLGMQVLKQPWWLKLNAENFQMVNEDDEPTQEQIDLIVARTGYNADDLLRLGDWYSLLRNFQGDMKTLFSIGFAIENKNFILDSLFCEWGYIINVDTEKLEVYKGFQNKRHNKGRYADSPINLRHRTGDSIYYPCALEAEFNFDNLPTESEFLDRFCIGDKVEIDPKWMSSTVVDLLKVIMDEKLYERLPIFSDALMDAGCDNDKIIRHCQANHKHCEECWVLQSFEED